MKWTDAAVFQWLEMPAGYSVAGPAIVEHPETTVYVGHGQTARLDDAGNLSIDLT
jgi:N-methylhydantoinase A